MTQRRTRLRPVGLTLLLIVLLASQARAQWIEEIVGTWHLWAFGMCGVVGCFDGPRLCAQIVSSGVTTWCYRN